MARPRKIDARDTRRLILDAALDLFAQAGYAGVSMRQLARAVGVRESALYHHFPSKEAILRGLLDELGPGHARQFDALDVAAMVKQLGRKAFLKLMARTVVDVWATPREQKMARIILSDGPRLATLGALDPRAEIGAARARVERVLGEVLNLKRRQAALTDATLAFMGPLIFLRAIHLIMVAGPPDLAALHREVDRHVEHYWATHAKLNVRS